MGPAETLNLIVGLIGVAGGVGGAVVGALLTGHITRRLTREAQEAEQAERDRLAAFSVQHPDGNPCHGDTGVAPLSAIEGPLRSRASPYVHGSRAVPEATRASEVHE